MKYWGPDKMAVVLHMSFLCRFLKWKLLHLDSISAKSVSRASINNKPALVQTVTWIRIGDKPPSEPAMHPGPPTPGQNEYHARTHFRKERGNFSKVRGIKKKG